MSKKLTRDEILHLFIYDRERGLLIWKNPPQPNTKRLSGKLAGTIDKDGYVMVMVKKKGYKAHRIVWFLETGLWPKIVDHINGNVVDNRIKNLRNVTFRENCQNTYRHRSGKLVGANWHKSSGVWRSVIVINGKQKHLGRFKTELDAHERYIRELRLL